MSEYQVIARKWRPQRFADVVGQEHIVTTLKNAIRRQRTAHAYLFVGPRGIGKTTTARIFAKALNCEAPEDGEPCCKCNSCVTIANESNIDVREIDAASQNSVDSIRDLRDDAMHTPVSCRYKIYVIDEVHMLSKQAWNALLKTVEEPPPHVKFIFATTEVHQVLGTIISRCQRFDLQRIGSRLICKRLREIADAEQVRISDIAIEAVARAADGGMRDAQSLLDQMIAFFGGEDDEISEAKVLSLFGLSTAGELITLIKAIFANNVAGVITAIYNLSCRGKNLETLFNDLLSWLRSIHICGLIGNPENILEDGEEMIENYRQLAKQVDTRIVQLLLEVLAPVGRTLHDALNKQVYLESIILKAMRSAHAVQIDDLINRLNQLRNQNELEVLNKLPSLAEQPPVLQIVQTDQPNIEATAKAQPEAVEQAANAPQANVEATAKVQSEPIEQVVTAPQTNIEATSQSQNKSSAIDNSKTVIPATKTSASIVIETQSVEQNNIEDVAVKSTETVELSTAPPTVEQPVAVAPAVEQSIAAVETVKISDEVIIKPDSAVAIAADDLVAPQDFELTKQTPAEIEAENAPAKPLTAEDVWHRMIQEFSNDAQANPQLKTYMLEATPETFDESTLTVCFDDEYEIEHYNAINDELLLMNQLIQKVVNDWAATINLQKRPSIRKKIVPETLKDSDHNISENSTDYNAAKSAIEVDTTDEDEKKSVFGDETVMKQVEANDFVKYSVDLFGGRIVDVHG
jgi:DNA polymerase-3 subunit gamma/tau